MGISKKSKNMSNFQGHFTGNKIPRKTSGQSHKQDRQDHDNCVPL